MKRLIYQIVIISLLSFSTIFVSNAQLRFPNGKVMDLYTHVNSLYFETEIRFYTGSLSVDNYNWEKISDSIDTRWLIGSCFNGDCWNGLPSNGGFIKSFGINDTTGFIRFHIDTYDTNGKSVIKYRVVNKNDPSDQAELTFTIIFEKELGIETDQSHFQPISVFKNTANNSIRIQFNGSGQLLSCRIIDIKGNIVFETDKPGKVFMIDNLAKGVYIVELKTIDNTCFKKIINY